MNIQISIPEYTTSQGLKYQWVDGFEIEVKSEGQVITITANHEGLLSLANHFLNLAQENVPIGYHMHFDEDNALKEGSSQLIIQKGL